jgi:PAS domain-containing protein
MFFANGDRRIAELFRLAHRRLASLDLADTFSLPQLISAVERDRGRPIHLIAKQLPSVAPQGLWIAGEQGDYIFYDSAAGAMRHYQIIGHELGHLLLDDDAVAADPGELAALLVPEADPTLVARLRMRTAYTDPVERRAEVFGTVVLSAIDGWSARQQPRILHGELGRLSSALEGVVDR